MLRFPFAFSVALFAFAGPVWAGDCVPRSKVIGWPEGRVYQGGEPAREDFAGGQVILIQADVATARAGMDMADNPAVFITMTPVAAQRFGGYTKDHIGAPIAISFDEKVLNAPVVVRSIIHGGHGMLTGMDTEEQAEGVAKALTAPGCTPETGA
ncbi:MAG: hypothetical protein CSA70_03925 [Rhodobacterales bacterium]|nr:MAG: hypothetical protein CSA70_03925 [Rhodobacterales bacterium]